MTRRCFLVTSVALLLLGGCAAGGQGRPRTDDVRVEVVNDLQPRGVLTVRVTDANSAFRSILGNVSPGSTRTFWFGLAAGQGDYRLVAETADGRDVESRLFQVRLGDQVEWSVQTNRIVLGLQQSSVQ